MLLGDHGEQAAFVKCVAVLMHALLSCLPTASISIPPFFPPLFNMQDIYQAVGHPAAKLPGSGV